jgi:hypothetical protein
MDNKKDFRVDGKCAAETYADHCRCTRGNVYGAHPCTFYEGGWCVNDKKEEVCGQWIIVGDKILAR